MASEKWKEGLWFLVSGSHLEFIVRSICSSCLGFIGYDEISIVIIKVFKLWISNSHTGRLGSCLWTRLLVIYYHSHSHPHHCCFPRLPVRVKKKKNYFWQKGGRGLNFVSKCFRKVLLTNSWKWSLLRITQKVDNFRFQGKEREAQLQREPRWRNSHFYLGLALT